MNIVRVIFRKRVLAGLFCIALVGCALAYALAPHEVRPFFDQKIGELYRDSIRKTVEQSFLQAAGVHAVLSTLQKKCPAIASLDVRFRSSLIADVTVKAYSPWVCIASSSGAHKEYVVCKTGELIEKKYFSETALSGLPVFYIAGAEYEEKKEDPQCKACAREIDTALFERFTITWYSKSEIILQSSHPRMLLIADVASVHDEEKRIYAERIFRSQSDRYKYGIKVDMRLRDSLVCSPL